MNLIGDLARFAELQVESMDMDPLYPVLRWLQQPLSREEALWHTVLYVAYYNAASSQTAFECFEEPTQIQGALAKLPTGVERRGLRGGLNLTRHIDSWLAVIDSCGSLSTFFNTAIVGTPEQNWQTMQGLLRCIWGNGRWAAYKTGEVLMKVNILPLQPTDMGNDFSTGPRKGLELFFEPVAGHGAEAVALLDWQGREIQDRLHYQGVDLPIEEIETVLCDFHALAEGRYYVGKDIDDLQEAIIASPYRVPYTTAQDALWMARRAALPHAYLGELTGRGGVDKDRMKRYARSQEILHRG